MKRLKIFQRFFEREKIRLDFDFFVFGSACNGFEICNSDVDICVKFSQKSKEIFNKVGNF